MQWKTRFSPHDTHGDWIVLDGGETVCYVLDYGHARLIAKAPDLKAALAWALDQIEDDLDPDHQAALAHARSLLED
jgi:hypothetical protein